MFDFLKRKKETTSNAPDSTSVLGWLKKGLTKTRTAFTSHLANLFLGKKELTPQLLEELEMALLTADIGVETTQHLVQTLTEKLARKELNDGQAAYQCLKTEMKSILRPCVVPLVLSDECKPFVLLVVGVNGSGKTTTIGKMAHYFKQKDKKILMAAGDTFRAAAIEQLQAWGHRNQLPVIAQQPGADPAAVIYDAMEAAKARGVDLLLADTAGRLHTQSTLMAELKKVKRVLSKMDATAPHEILIVLDATLGQNALNQVRQFNEALGVTGIALTKLDGTAKGGILFALAKETKIPIRFIGVGENSDDLRPFDADDFVDALLP